MSSKKSTTKTTDQKTSGSTSGSSASGGFNQRDVYDPARQGLNSGLGMMQRWQDDPGSAATYSGNRVADLSAGTQQGMARLLGNQGYDQSGEYLQNVVSGDYLNAGNPHMQSLQESISNSVLPGVNATFAGSGMTGASNHQYHVPKALGDAMAPHMFANYENERNRQAQAAMALPAMYSQQANDALRAGGIQDQQNQNVINADMFAFNEARDRPMQVANAGFGNFLGAGQAFGRAEQGQWGTQQGTSDSHTQGTTTTTDKQSPFSQIMGGAMMGLGALSRVPGLGGMVGGGGGGGGMVGGGGGGGGMMGGAPMQAASMSAVANNPMSTLQNYNYSPPVIPPQIVQPRGNVSYGYGSGF